jgi:hypothetical protein
MPLPRLIAHGIVISVALIQGCNKGSIPAPTATEIFHLRSECATLAEQLRTHHPGDTLSRTLSHYEPQTNRCYVETNNVALGNLVHVLYDGKPAKF